MENKMNKWNLRITEGMYGPVHTIDDGGKTNFMIRDEAYYPTASMTEQQWKLVAAAPELLEALKNCVAFIEEASIEEAQWHWEPIETASKAIQKATGAPTSV